MIIKNPPSIAWPLESEMHLHYVPYTLDDFLNDFGICLEDPLFVMILVFLVLSLIGYFLLHYLEGIDEDVIYPDNCVC